MKRTSLTLATLLFLNWLASVIGFRMSLDIFKEFKIELPALTWWGITLTHPFFLLPLTTLILGIAVLLALRHPLGWSLAFAACFLCDLLFVGYLLPSIALFNGLSGGDGSGISLPPAPTVIWGNPGASFLLAATLLTQVIFVILLMKRRDWTSSAVAIRQI